MCSFFIKANIAGTQLNYLDKFIKAYAVVNSLELPQLVQAIQRHTHNICYYKEVDDIAGTAI